MPQVLTLLGPMAHAASLLHHDHHAHGHDQIQQQPQMMKSKVTTKLTSVTMQLKNVLLPEPPSVQNPRFQTSNKQ